MSNVCLVHLNIRWDESRGKGVAHTEDFEPGFGKLVLPCERVAHAVDFKLEWGPGQEKEVPHHA